MQPSRRTLSLDPDGGVILAPGANGHAQALTEAEAVTRALEAGEIRGTAARALAGAAALALSARNRAPLRQVEQLLPRLLALGGPSGARSILRLREVLEITPQPDRDRRARLELSLLEGDLLAEEEAQAHHLHSLLQAAGATHPGQTYRLLLDPALDGPGLNDPGPLGQALARTAEDGWSPEGVAWTPGTPGLTPGRAGLALIAAPWARMDGTVALSPQAHAMASAAGIAGLPVWAVLAGDAVAEAGTAPPGDAALLPGSRLAGHVTIRGLARATGGGLAALFPERVAVDDGDLDPGLASPANEA
ncbi:MAG: hypothetical protein RLY86_1160 [Pseudomonadota bacterium]|jgi:hypothetical protein